MTDPRPRRRRERHDLLTLAGKTLPMRWRVIDRRRRPTARPEASTAKAALEPSRSLDEAKRKQAKARSLWAQRQPSGGTVAEVYLRAGARLCRRDPIDAPDRLSPMPNERAP
jgi:hypothetical protein